MKRNKLASFLIFITIASACAQEKSTKDKFVSVFQDCKKILDTKVDSLNLFNEKPIPDIKVNQNHLFEISPCELKYNGKIFKLGGTMQELIDIFGKGRVARHGFAYAWDDYGFSVLLDHHTNTTKEFRICFDCCDWVDPSDTTGTMPKGCFEGGVLIDGVVLGNGLPFDVFKERLREVGSKVSFSGFYRDNVYRYGFNCDYDGGIKSNQQENHAFVIDTKVGSINESEYRIFTISDNRAIHKLEMDYKASKNNKASN